MPAALSVAHLLATSNYDAQQIICAMSNIGVTPQTLLRSQGTDLGQVLLCLRVLLLHQKLLLCAAEVPAAQAVPVGVAAVCYKAWLQQ